MPLANHLNGAKKPVYLYLSVAFRLSGERKPQRKTERKCLYCRVGKNPPSYMVGWVNIFAHPTNLSGERKPQRKPQRKRQRKKFIL